MTHYPAPSSLLTLCWSKGDSNSGSHVLSKRDAGGISYVPARWRWLVRGALSCPRCSRWDPEFESTFLHRRVCKPSVPLKTTSRDRRRSGQRLFTNSVSSSRESVNEIHDGHRGKLPPKLRFASDAPLEEDRLELVWGFSCQVVVFGLLPVLCSERESRSSSRRLRSGSRSARKGSRDRNASTAWRLAA